MNQESEIKNNYRNEGMNCPMCDVDYRVVPGDGPWNSGNPTPACQHTFCVDCFQQMFDDWKEQCPRNVRVPCPGCPSQATNEAIPCPTCNANLLPWLYYNTYYNPCIERQPYSRRSNRRR